MQRGFKARCERISEGYRIELGIPVHQALTYQTLAKHLGVFVYLIDDLPYLDDIYISRLRDIDGDDWSAFTVMEGKQSLIVLNSTHSERRLQNDAMHELSHIVLAHPPLEMQVVAEDMYFSSRYNKALEDEADWLAATLLLPRKGLLTIYGQCLDVEQTANHFGVSTQLTKMRLQRTGILNQLKSRSGRR